MDLVTVGSEVFDRTTGRPGWAVLATYARGPEDGDAVCVEYRVRALRGDSPTELVENLHRTLHAMENHAVADIAGLGPFPAAGIPRYVFEQAPQGKMLARARAKLKKAAPAILAPPPRKTGRPPTRTMHEKLRILAAVERANTEGRPLEYVARDFHMSRSALRDLLSWARHDATPRLFTAAGQGRRGGELTPDARTILAELEGTDRG